MGQVIQVGKIKADRSSRRPSYAGRSLQYRLGNHVRVEALGTALAADAALLNAAKGRVRLAGAEMIDGHDAAFELAANPFCIVK